MNSEQQKIIKELTARISALEDFIFSENKSLNTDFNAEYVKESVILSIKKGYATKSQIKQRALKCCVKLKNSEVLHPGTLDALISEMVISGRIELISIGRKKQFKVTGG